MKEELRKIKYIVVDVDGTMTDTGIFYDDKGNELKKFSTRDYVGIMAAHYIGLRVLILTGRACPATERRAKELHVDEVYQNVKNKVDFMKRYLVDYNLNGESFAYIGDDLNDYGSMQLVGFKACPADAAPEIISICDYVSTFRGGTGVVQDVLRYILGSIGRWDDFIREKIEPGY